MSSKLKPCPFCGGEVRIVHNEPYTLGAIVCDTCKALVMFPWYKTESQLDLKEEWDKRAEPEMQTLPVHTMPRYIDADLAINDLCGSQCGCTINECGLEEPCEKARCILKQPTADVQEVKHGHWIYGECGNDKYIKCSFCRKIIVNNIVTLEGDIAETAFVLCPYCGAVMDEEQEEITHWMPLPEPPNEE